MSDHPIIFTPHSVRAIRAGIKTQTRRVLGHDGPPDSPATEEYGKWEETCTKGHWIGVNEAGTTIFAQCHFGTVGDRLWVKEASRNYPNPMFMPRAASRITLQLTSVGVQRLQDISDNDVDAEGFGSVEEFRATWNQLNAKRNYNWERNPWVWVLAFKVVKP